MYPPLLLQKELITIQEKDSLKYRTPYGLVCPAAMENCMCIDVIT